MNHVSLYRAYRPSSFRDVIGQRQVTDALASQVKTGTPGHAYLFAGSRGLGKTSVARIFAGELGVSSKDLYEIDAASNNSVDDIRALTENVYTLPFDSPYKVYLLDEAHMLSKGAWNAFLKTLEEPPAHAVFILATTEAEKIPDTVQSRCQVFTFRKPSREDLATLVSTVAEKEQIALAPGVPELIALLAEGSYRDALSVLERVAATAGGKRITREAAEEATGAPRAALVRSLIEALGAGDTEQALIAIRAASEAGVDMTLYLSLVLEALRTVLLLRHAPSLRDTLLHEVGEDGTFYATLAQESRITHDTLLAFLQAASRIRYAPVPALVLELATLEALRA